MQTWCYVFGLPPHDDFLMTCFSTVIDGENVYDYDAFKLVDDRWVHYDVALSHEDSSSILFRILAGDYALFASKDLDEFPPKAKIFAKDIAKYRAEENI